VRILFVTTGIASPPTHGSQIRRWNVLQGLLAAGDTDALVFCRASDPDSLEAFAGCAQCIPMDAQLLESCIQHERYRSTIGRGMLALSSWRPFEFQYPGIAELRAEVGRRVDLEHYDLVWFNTAHTAMALRGLPCGISILDGDDFEYVREKALLGSSPWYGAKAWNYLNLAKLWWWERSWAKYHEAVVRCSNEDRVRHPAPNVVVIPNGAYIPEFCQRAPEHRLLFVGLMSYPPNSEAMQWFVERIWPRVRQEIPDAVCDIVGKHPPAFFQELPADSGVVAHGFVHDLAPFYRRATASIAPLRAGSGTRLKILESLAHAVPVISTSLGAFGIDAGVDQGLHRSDTEDEFAAQCIAQLRRPDAYQQAAESGREFVRENYDWNAIQSRVAHLARRVAGVEGHRQVEIASPSQCH
jgi:polysaccharide biosynthesis protein PslH